MSMYGPTPPTPPSMLPSSVGFSYNGMPGGPLIPQTMFNGPLPNSSNGGPQYWADPNAFASWAAAAAAQSAAPQTSPSPVVSSRPALPTLPPLPTAGTTTAASSVASICDPGRRLFNSIGFSPFVDVSCRHLPLMVMSLIVR